MPSDSPESLAARPYADLTPETILSAAEAVGLQPTGGFQALNSYENRVYKLETETSPWAIKFYRPGRWSDAAIREEHAFTQALVDDEIPAVAPYRYRDETLFYQGDYRFALFPWHPGRTGGLETVAERVAFGHYLGRLHLAGQGRFKERLTLDTASFVTPAIATLRDCPFLPGDLRGRFLAITERLRDAIAHAFATVDPAIFRLHGDCHPGNVLFDGEHFAIVDFDDCLNGPAIQDIWMLLPGDRSEQEEALAALIRGYEMFRSFNYNELRLIEPLRALRLLHYNAWIARRWHDPAFPRIFPWFSEDRHFRELVLLLESQEERLAAPPIQASGLLSL
ncbi:MAG: serine/threonine protein kinase [Acidiferrobacter sp.]